MAIKVILKNGTPLEFAQGQLDRPGLRSSRYRQLPRAGTVGYEVVALMNTAEVLAAYDSGVWRDPAPNPL